MAEPFEAHVGLLKLIGKQSRNALVAAGLTDAEIEEVFNLYHRLT